MFIYAFLKLYSISIHNPDFTHCNHFKERKSCIADNNDNCVVFSVEDAENDTFNLLLMCSSEREDGSFLASAWDEFRIVPHRCPSTEEASKFLKEQLMCDPRFNQSDYVHAGCADEER